jgi:hypothetical protein
MARGPLAGPAGPGKFSTRTDGLSFQSPEYGAGVEQAAIKAGAKLSKTPDVRGMPASEVREAASQEPLTKLFDPSARQDEDIMAGAPIGPGPGPEALAINQVRPAQKQSALLEKLLPFDETGEIAILYQQALAQGN